MTESDFHSICKTSSALPLCPVLSFVNIPSLAESLSRFINENFRAAAAVSYESLDGSAVICEEYAAYFFKALLKGIFGRNFINIRISSSHKGLFINIRSDKRLPLRRRESNELIKIARAAGFEIQPHDNGFTLSAQLAVTSTAHIYTYTPSKNSFYLSLCDIFFKR